MAYVQPTLVFSSCKLQIIESAEIHFVKGNIQQVHTKMRIVPNGKYIWIVGSGDLAGQFYVAGLLDEVINQIGSLTLGKVKSLFPRRVLIPIFQLISTRQMGVGMVESRYKAHKDN